MSKDNTVPRWAKWAGGISLLSIALAAGALGLVLNVAHGLEAGLAAGIAFGLADGAKVLIPLVAGTIGWTRQMKITAAICVAVSLWSAVNVYLDGAGRDLLAKQHGAEAYAEKAKTIAELESEAARLDSLAAQEARKGGCGTNCRSLTEQASAVRRRLQNARSAREQAKPVEISGLAAMIAMVSGASADGIARGISAVKALLFLMLVEVLVWLSVPAMALLDQAARREVVVEIVNVVATPVEPVAIPIAKSASQIAKIATPAVKAVAKSSGGTKTYYQQRIERDFPEIAKRVANGEISVYAASVAAGLRKSRAETKWAEIKAYIELEKAGA